MLSQAQIEKNDGDVIRNNLDNIADKEARYNNLLAYYLLVDPEDNHNQHLAALLKILKQKTADKKETYKKRLTKNQRQGLYKMLIVKDLLLRNQSDNKIVKDYLRYHSYFEFRRAEIKEVILIYAGIAELFAKVAGFIDKYFIDLDRAISERKIEEQVVPVLEYKPPSTSLRQYVASSGYFEADPITQWVEDELLSVLKQSNKIKCLKEFTSFIDNTISPFDARKLSFQLWSTQDKVPLAFFKKFKKNSTEANKLIVKITKRGEMDNEWYASSNYKSVNSADEEKAKFFKDREYRDRRSYSQEKKPTYLKPAETVPVRELTIRPKIVEAFTEKIKIALYSNKQDGKPYDYVIEQVRLLTSDEVRYCLNEFVLLQKDPNIKEIIKHGYRTRQIFKHLIEQGVYKCTPIDDFTEEYYKKFQQSSLDAGNLDGIQTYYTQLSEPVPFQGRMLNGEEPKTSIYKLLRDKVFERKSTISMVYHMIAFHVKNSDVEQVTISDLIILNPFPDDKLKISVNNFIERHVYHFGRHDYNALISSYKRFTEFLDNQTNPLALFQILKWVSDYLRDVNRVEVEYKIGLEIYLEVYSTIIRFSFLREQKRAYVYGIPKEDQEYFFKPLSDIYFSKGSKDDYWDRLRFAASRIEQYRSLTEYMFFLYVFAAESKTILIHNHEREKVRNAKIENYNNLGDRYRVPDRGYPSIVSTIKIGSKIAGFEVYYISDLQRYPNEQPLRKYGFGKIYLIHPKITGFLFELFYELIGEKQYGDFIADIYERTKGMIPVYEAFFKYIGYLPVLVEVGVAATVYEIVVGEVTEKVGEKVADVTGNRWLGMAVSFGGSFVTPSSIYKSPSNKILENQLVESRLVEFNSLPKPSSFTEKKVIELEPKVMNIESPITTKPIPPADASLSIKAKTPSEISITQRGLPEGGRLHSTTTPSSTIHTVDSEMERVMSTTFDLHLNLNFDIRKIPDESYLTTVNLKKGNFGERIAAESLATNGHTILLYKPDISGTNQGGIDIVTFFDGKVYFIDNKAARTGKNISNVSALTTNFTANKASILRELRTMRARAIISMEELDLINKAIVAVKNNNYERIITNAAAIRNLTEVSRGITPRLMLDGIGFIDFFPPTP